MTHASVKIKPMSDTQLVALARRGEQEAFGELVRRNWCKCVDIGCLYLRNRGDAEDQAQAAIVKAYEHLDQYQGDAEFATWLARIVANECLMLMRARRRMHFVYLDEAPRDEKPETVQLPAGAPDPEDELATREFAEVLEHEIRRIPPLMRNVMLLRDIQGLPMKDVAVHLGITVSAAKSRLVRARAQMRLRMIRHSSGRANLAACGAYGRVVGRSWMPLRGAA